MTADKLAELKQQILGLDEATLTAMANKGLVRRATKDLQSSTLSHEESDAIVVHGPDWKVTIPVEGPSHAFDDTKATGVTRQILTAFLYLQQQWQSAAPAPPASDTFTSLEAALLSLTPDAIQSWSGKTALRTALHLIETHPEVEIKHAHGWSATLTHYHVQGHFLPSDVDGSSPKLLLNQMLTSGPSREHKQWVAAVILAFQKSRGKAPARPKAATTAAVSDGPRSRAEILQSTKDLMESMVGTGIAHPSIRMQERLLTLSVSAIGANLPRLSRNIRALADDIGLLLARDANADTARLLHRLSRTNALVMALLNAGESIPLDLAGRHRTEYDPVGDLMLAGVGAYPWQSASGFEGLTVLFWDLKQQQFYTWTSTRPVGQMLPLRLYFSDTLWESGTPELLCRSFFTLHAAKANPHRRLSASLKCTTTLCDQTDPSRIDYGSRGFESWTALRSYAQATAPMGLKENNPLDQVVVLKPSHWGERSFDELNQRLVWDLFDAQGDQIELILPWLGVNESSVDLLEAVKPERDRIFGIVARVELSSSGLYCEPLSLLSHGTGQGDRILNPAFDRSRIDSQQSALLEKLRKKHGKDRVPTQLAETEPCPELQLPKGLELCLIEVDRLLLRLAEAGSARLDEHTQQQIQDLAERASHCGFTAIGEALSNPQSYPATVLWVSYLCTLHRQAAEAMWIGQSDPTDAI